MVQARNERRDTIAAYLFAAGTILNPCRYARGCIWSDLIMIPAKSLQKDTLQQITAKIRQASTVDELKRLEKSCDRLYSCRPVVAVGF
jgi:hypothetical protein